MILPVTHWYIQQGLFYILRAWVIFLGHVFQKKRILFTCNISNEIFFFQNSTMVHKQVLLFNWFTGLVIIGEGFNKSELLLFSKLKLFDQSDLSIMSFFFLLFKQLKGNAELEQVTQNQGSCWPFRTHLPKKEFCLLAPFLMNFFFFKIQGTILGVIIAPKLALELTLYRQRRSGK